jgi:hypothetical protein
MASVRRVRRVIRKFDPWTVLKVSIVFYAVMAVAIVLGLVILWAVVNNAGIPLAIEDFGKKITLLEADAELFADGERYLRVAVFLGVVWTVLLTGFTTLAALMYNLISDIVGGIEIVVLEETLNGPQGTQAGVRIPRSWQTTTPPPTSSPTSDQMDLPTEQVDLSEQPVGSSFEVRSS